MIPNRQALAQSHPRPFATYYYASVRDATKDYSKIGRASSIRGAIRAAVGHIFDGKYSSCDVYNVETGMYSCSIKRQGDRINITNIRLF